MITQELLDAITLERERDIASFRLAQAARASTAPPAASPRGGLWRDGLRHAGRNVVHRAVDPALPRSSSL